MTTVIDWYENKLIQLDIDFGGHKNYWIERKKIREQAKEMEKQQIIDAYKKYQSYLIEEFLIKERTYKGIAMHKPFEGNSKTFEQWIETYGSKGSDETKTN